MHMPTVDMNKQPMNIVFRLRDELPRQLEHVRRIRRLTMDASQPDSGLSGRYGLFGSLEWWNNIALGRMPLLRLSGKVERCRVAEADREGVHVIEIRAVDGSLHAVEVHAADVSSLVVFQTLPVVSVLCGLDELKRQPVEPKERVAKIALEMAVAPESLTGHSCLPITSIAGSISADIASVPYSTRET